MVASDLVRSSKKKAAASKRQRTRVTESLQAFEGDKLTEGLDLHRRTLLEIYGQALSDGWAPSEIGLDWLVPELQHALQDWYDDDYFRIVYDGEFAPGMMAAAQQPSCQVQTRHRTRCESNHHRTSPAVHAAVPAPTSQAQSRSAPNRHSVPARRSPGESGGAGPSPLSTCHPQRPVNFQSRASADACWLQPFSWRNAPGLMLPCFDGVRRSSESL